MSVIARQSTARTVMVGPVLDASGVAVTDGVVGDLKISKNGAAPAALNGSATLTHRHTGHYSLALTTSDLDTVGQAEVVMDDTVNAMPAKVITVIEEAVYDALFAASAAGYSTFAGGAVASVTGNVGGNVTGSVGSVASGGITAASFGANAITAAKLDPDVTTELQAGLATSAALTTVEGKIDTLDTNVDTLLTRITSTLFTGITSLAEWLGLMAGKQTGDTTARTELRATGAGSGTYTETTDSLEAVRDRGDAAWLTATGFSTHSAADVWAVATRLLTAGTNIVLAKGTGVTGFNDLSAAQVNSEVDTALADIHLDHLLAVTYDPASKPGAADALLNELIEDDAGVARYTANALEQAPTGGSAPSAATIADAVWDEVLAGHAGAGSAGEALAAAGTAGDPWTTALPGAYGAGTAGKIVGDNLNATVSSRATQTSVDDLPTNAELATSQAAADDATLAAIAALNNLSAAGVRTELATELARIDATISSRATPAQVNTEADTALADVGLTSVVTGRIDAAVSTRATPAQVATELGTYDAPTKAELDAAQAAIEAAIDAAEAAILAAIPTANVNADALLDRSNGIETSLTLRGALRLIVAASAGKLSGAATSTVVIRNVGDTKDRITATVDADGNRSAVTTDAA